MTSSVTREPFTRIVPSSTTINGVFCSSSIIGLMGGRSGAYTSTLTRSSSGKELLLPLGEFFHALQSFFLPNDGTRRALDFEFLNSLQLFHKTSAPIFLYPNSMSTLIPTHYQVANNDFKLCVYTP